MTPARKDAVVVGAGLTGLASAAALRSCGYDVRILERDDRLRATGAGLTLWPNAVRALRELGLGSVVDDVTLPIAEAVTLTPGGGVLTRVPLERLAQYGPLVSAHRADLLDALAARTDSPIEFGAEVRVADGRLFSGEREIAADLVVGADGINSATRELVAPGVAPRPAGYAAWRGVAELPEGTVTRASETMGRGRRFGLVPLPRGRVYWFAVVAGADDDLAAVFDGWHAPIAEVLSTTPESEPTHLPLSDLPPLPAWYRDRVVLAGDAAHGMTPNLGQGAAQSFEDAAVLARELKRHPVAGALAAYQHARKKRAERVVRQSRSVGRIVQASSPAAVWTRNLLARRMPAGATARQFASIVKPS